MAAGGTAAQTLLFGFVAGWEKEPRAIALMVNERNCSDVTGKSETIPSPVASPHAGEALLAAIAGCADAIVLIDADGKVLYANPAAGAINGYRPEELVQKHVWEVDPEFSPETWQIHWQSLKQRGSLLFQAVNRHRDGHTVPVEVRATYICWNGREYNCSIARDISDRVAAEEFNRLQIEGEKLAIAISQRIHSRLRLPDILRAAASEIRQFLRADRVAICQFPPEGDLLVLAESPAPADPQNRPAVERPARWDHPPFLPIHSVVAATGEARVLFPMAANDTLASGRIELWGMLVADRQAGEVGWQPYEIQLVSYLVTQVEIAIEQSQIYEQLQAANNELKRLVSIDYLTQVANRKTFDEYLKQQWDRLGCARQPLSLVMCDIDFFKLYNDAYGHIEGDACLQKVAQAIQHSVRRSVDVVARYGGEEFGIILPDMDSSEALVVAERIRRNVRDLRIEHADSPHDRIVTLSLGVASIIPVIGEQPNYLLAAADYALFQAKQGGRDLTYAIA